MAETGKEITCSLEELIRIIDSGNVQKRFQVGDYKKITLYTGEELDIFIFDFDRDVLASGGKAKVTFGVLGIDGRYSPKQDPYPYTWKNSTLRTRMARIFKLLPPALQKHIKPVKKVTPGSSEAPEKTEEKLFPFSRAEVLGNYYPQPGEISNYKYFTLSLSSRYDRGAYGYTFYDTVWLREPRRVVSSVKSYFDGKSEDYYGIAFGFCI